MTKPTAMLVSPTMFLMAAIYSRMATGGARTYADLVWIRLAARVSSTENTQP